MRNVDELPAWLYEYDKRIEYYGDGRTKDGKEVLYIDIRKLDDDEIETLKKELQKNFGKKVSLRKARSEYAPEQKKTVIIIDDTLEESATDGYKYIGRAFFDENYRGLSSNIRTNDYDDLFDWVWKNVQAYYVEVKNQESGKTIRLNPDDYDFWTDDLVGDKIENDLGLINESLKEGVSKDMTPEEIAKKHKVSADKINKQLEKGIKVEKEHTDDEKKARRIALDHLFEIPDYYDRLGKMERGALKEDPNTKDLVIVKPELPRNWVIAKYGKKYALMSKREFDRAKENPEKWFKEWTIDLFPSKKELIRAFKREPAYKSIFDGIELNEDTVKTSSGKWVNKGKEGTHGAFKTKTAADAQRRAMFANKKKGAKWGESLEEEKVAKVDGMNILQYVDNLMDTYNMSEEDAWNEADIAFGISEINESTKPLAKKFKKAKVENLKESMGEEVRDWWDSVESWNRNPGFKYMIDNYGVEDEDLLTAMYDMLKEIKKDDEDLYNRGKKIYNKYSQSKIK